MESVPVTDAGVPFLTSQAAMEASSVAVVVVSKLISLKGLSRSEEADLQRAYTFVPKVPFGVPGHRPKPKPVRLYRKIEVDTLLVTRDPRLLSLYPDARDEQPVVSSSPLVNFTGVLDPMRQQVEAVEACIASLRRTPLGGGAVLCLPPGYGKTACSLYISSMVGRRTLILVHTSVLARQWLDRISSFLEGASTLLVTPVKVVTREVVSSKTHVVVLLQTVVALLKRETADVGWLDMFDLTIFDEVHHLCARTLCQVVEAVGSRYRLGLSATPERKDGLHPMLDVLIGPIAYRCERKAVTDVSVQVIKFTSPTMIRPTDTHVGEITAIVRDRDRTRCLAEAILSHRKRFMLVLSDRLEQLAEIRSMITPTLPSFMAVGGTKEDVNVEARPVVLATYAYASEGLDIPELNTCILATPRTDVCQSIGRILRRTSSDGDHAPLVIDMVDSDRPILHRQFLKRKAYYLKSPSEGGLGASLSFIFYQKS